MARARETELWGSPSHKPFGFTGAGDFSGTPAGGGGGSQLEKGGVLAGPPRGWGQGDKYEPAKNASQKNTNQHKKTGGQMWSPSPGCPLSGQFLDKLLPMTRQAALGNPNRGPSPCFSKAFAQIASAKSIMVNGWDPPIHQRR